MYKNNFRIQLLTHYFVILEFRTNKIKIPSSPLPYSYILEIYIVVGSMPNFLCTLGWINKK